MILWLLGCPAPTGLVDTGAATVVPVTRPNVLVILADDVGLDSIGAYEVHPAPARTPTLDALAASSVRFDSAWGTPACSAARAQLLTGRFGRRYGLGNIVSLADGAQPYDLPEAEQTIGDLAREAGYTSIYIGKWHLTSYTHSWRDAPARHGFDRYRTTAGNLIASSSGEPGGYDRFERNDNGEVAFVDAYVTSVQTDDAIEEAESVAGPWLMVVAYNAAHEPFELPPAHLHSQQNLDADSPEPVRYRAVVEALDHEIGRLLTTLDRGNTRVVFASDNGTPIQALLPPTPPLQGKPSPKEGGLQVPLMIRAPGLEPGVSAARVQLVDLHPTVAGWLSVSPTHDLDGFDLAPQLENPSTPSPRKVQYTDTFPVHHQPNDPSTRRIAVRDDRWKFLVIDKEPHLYDLSLSRWDTPQNDVIGAADPELLQSFRDAVEHVHQDAPYAY